MNTNRDSSAHTRRIAARTITMDHILNPVRRGQNTYMEASYITKVQLGPTDNFLAPIYTERVLGQAPASAPSLASAPAPAPGPVGPSGATPVQLLVNSGFTNGTTGWSSPPDGFQTYDFFSGSLPAVTETIDDNGLVGSSGYLVFSFVSRTVSQTVSISNIADYNIITAVINIARTPNRENIGLDNFSFQVVYKNASNVTVATKRTPASGTQTVPSTFTDYTLTFTRDDSADFDTIVSATVNITAIDGGYWAGTHGPAVDYCTLTLT